MFIALLSEPIVRALADFAEDRAKAPITPIVSANAPNCKPKGEFAAAETCFLPSKWHFRQEKCFFAPNHFLHAGNVLLNVGYVRRTADVPFLRVDAFGDAARAEGKDVRRFFHNIQY